MEPADLEELKRAIQKALESGQLFPDDQMQQMLESLRTMTQEQMDQLLENLVQKLADEGTSRPSSSRIRARAGRQGREGQARFEVTDKSLDFLGFKTLKDLLGSLGKSSFGRHDTRDLATGIESSGSSKQYEFGDTLNLDISETLFSAVRREGVKVPIDLEYSDLHVHQCEYQSSCATVLMLDCSHSMILYGEDRFTPAKTRGDGAGASDPHAVSGRQSALRAVSRFRRGAEYQPAGARAGGSLLHQHARWADSGAAAAAAGTKDMKQIVMITDGKPSALTLEDGRTYRNAFGLDPLVISRTLEEVNRCKKQGIMINTFMLASDYGLMNFIQKVTELCRGKAYFTTPHTLGQYLLMDYMNRKTRTVH